MTNVHDSSNKEQKGYMSESTKYNNKPIWSKASATSSALLTL